MNTPWGYADHTSKLADGIIDCSTPGHGGIHLSQDRVNQLPAGLTNFTQDLRWWEEDCDWVVPYIIFQDDIRKYGNAYNFESNLETAYKIAERYHPELLAPAPVSEFNETDTGIQDSMLSEIPSKEVRVIGKGKTQQISLDDYMKLMEVTQ